MEIEEECNLGTYGEELYISRNKSGPPGDPCLTKESTTSTKCASSEGGFRL